jgi:homocysteine S-methyltransferase
MTMNPDALPRPLVLDGGLSNVLEDLGCDLNQSLWSAGMLLSDPESIVQAHLQYLRAGADIITTASYQASIEGFMSAGQTRAQAGDLLRRSVDLAVEARNRFRNEQLRGGREILVAASMGPYGAYLADGSEYTGVYDADDARIRAFHEPRLQCLAASQADLLAFETLPCGSEVAIIAELMDEIEKLAWVSFSCRDAGHLHDGTPVADAAALFQDVPAVFAVGANCTAPAYISDLIRLFRDTAPGKRVIVYPNSGEAYHADTRSWSGTSDPVEFQNMAAEWIALGAHIVGGCCRIGPEHIAQLRALVNDLDKQRR